MAYIIIAVVSILAVTVLFWAVNKLLPIKICPICAGVSGTWLWIAAGMTLGWLMVEKWQMVAAIIMGGTVVGIAYQGERKYPGLARNIFSFRVPVIIIGFLFVYWAISNIGWPGLGIEVLILAVVMYAYFIAPSKKSKAAEHITGDVGQLEEKLKECCD